MTYGDKRTPWGEASMECERNWYRHLPWDAGWGVDKKKYSELKRQALEDPTFDLFEHFMPTDRPKYDIGRYVMRHNVRVPLVNHLSEWQEALSAGTAMLRSELATDYTGPSGLLDSHVIGLDEIPPRSSERGLGTGFNWDGSRIFIGPVNVRSTLGFYEYNGLLHSSGPYYDDESAAGRIGSELIWGLGEGTVNPVDIMNIFRWNEQRVSTMEHAANWRLQPPYMRNASASRWRYVHGRNLKVMRDPVVEGKYFVGETNTHHNIWLLQNGRDSEDLAAYHNKGDHFPVYHGGLNPEARNEPEYVLSTKKIIDLYEKVRTLPYFDQRQAPLMELQYGDDGNVYFLQYLKTDRMINDPGEFSLPDGDGVVRVHDVSGATNEEGERLRIYLDPAVFTRSMENQGFYMSRELEAGLEAQAAAMMARVCIQDYFLSFKDGHFSSAPLVRPQVAIGLWGDSNHAEQHFNELMQQVKTRQWRYSRHEVTAVPYVDAVVTSNGRAAAIESDWSIKEEVVN